MAYLLHERKSFYTAVILCFSSQLEYQKNDPKCQLIHPDYVKIRESRSLRYWGHHLVDGSPPQLAFKSVANIEVLLELISCN